MTHMDDLRYMLRKAAQWADRADRLAGEDEQSLAVYNSLQLLRAVLADLVDLVEQLARPDADAGGNA